MMGKSCGVCSAEWQGRRLAGATELGLNSVCPGPLCGCGQVPSLPLYTKRWGKMISEALPAFKSEPKAPTLF